MGVQVMDISAAPALMGEKEARQKDAVVRPNSDICIEQR
jgi:hypothetical protein